MERREGNCVTASLRAISCTVNAAAELKAWNRRKRSLVGSETGILARRSLLQLYEVDPKDEVQNRDLSKANIEVCPLINSGCE